MNNTQLLWIIARLLAIIASVLLRQSSHTMPGHEKDLEYINSVLGRELP